VRKIVLALAALVGATAPARADVLPQFIDVPDNYVPNTPFTFELTAPGLNAFTDFNLDLIVHTTSLDPVTLMTVTVDRPGDSAFVFGPTGTFNSTQSSTSGSPLFIVNISGTSGGPGVSTTAGANDQLAVITVTPGATLSEPITFSIDSTTLTLNALSESGQGIQTPDPISVFPDTSGTPPPDNPVPGPGGFVLLGLGGLALIGRNRLARRA
jgi:hypothetical protein